MGDPIISEPAGSLAHIADTPGFIGVTVSWFTLDVWSTRHWERPASRSRGSVWE
jgi:hypothetical protein